MTKVTVIKMAVQESTLYKSTNEKGQGTITFVTNLPFFTASNEFHSPLHRDTAAFQKLQP
jgi:hypothetical protein